MRDWNASEKSSCSRRKIQLRADSSGGVLAGSTSRYTIGMSRLLCLTACASSNLQTFETTESGLRTNVKALADSIFKYASLSHSAVDGMSFQSTQVSRLMFVSALQ